MWFQLELSLGLGCQLHLSVGPTLTQGAGLLEPTSPQLAMGCQQSGGACRTPRVWRARL